MISDQPSAAGLLQTFGIWRKKKLFLRKPLRHRASILMTRKELAVNAPAKTNEIDSLLHPAQVAKLLGVSHSWLAKSRLNGSGPRFIKIGRSVRYAVSALREYILSRQRNSTSER
jgi:predicted DNA-binding transcriptional regulator AlpA